MRTILICDDNKRVYDSLHPNFAYYGFETRFAANGGEAAEIVTSEPIDLVLLDVMLGDQSGIDVLTQLKIVRPSVPVVMITGHGSIDTAVRSMKLGAFDYVKKPLDFERLLKVVDTALRVHHLDEENRALRQRLQELSAHVSLVSPKMRDVMERAAKLALADIPVLVTGENGSGKEVIADFIHANSPRVGRKMAKINCAAFPESLLDNELFGHERGAFTGADGTFRGVFERADKSSLFLDEIGDMPATIQAKILRVLQNSEIRRIGGDRTLTIDVRFIAATNMNLEELIEHGRFRRDLYYRLNAAVLHVPPLRERKEDIEPLVEYFVSQSASSSQKNIDGVSDEVMRLFFSHQWPGNIRELKNTITYAVALTSHRTIAVEDLPPAMQGGARPSASLNVREDLERSLIVRALQQYGYNKKRTAESLQMSRKTLYAKIDKYGIATN